jgi:hypothetical protein
VVGTLRAVLCLVQYPTQEELKSIMSFIHTRGMTLAGIARTFAGAEEMQAADEADLIVVDSSSHLPMDLLVISQEIRIAELGFRGRHRRPRRLRRRPRW